MNFLDLSLHEVRAALAAAGQPPYRADQIARWVYREGVTDPERMTNVPPSVAQQFVYLASHVAARSESADGTVKLLVELADGERIETVLIPTGRKFTRPWRATACLSTQVGCAVGCAFCASGLGGLKRSLAAGEILEQLVHLRQVADRRITHVVFMGMGEPLANYRATVAAVRAIIDPERFAVSARHVTVSTVGIPRAIRRLAAEDLPITLAVSLHAPDDELRRRLIPRAAPISEVLDAAEEFFAARGREVTLEYVLLAGVNDSLTCADGLAHLARRLRASVNLIPFNPATPGQSLPAAGHGTSRARARVAGPATPGRRPVEGLPYARPAAAAVRAFAARLRSRGANVHVRRSRGADADAACGQLRRHARQA